VACIWAAVLCHFIAPIHNPVRIVWQAFLESAKARTAFQPLPLPAVRLSPAEQCRVRDRSTIMARQLFAERGDEFADAQARPPPGSVVWLHVMVHETCAARVGS